MNRLLIIIKTCLLIVIAALLLSAARPLICYAYRLTNNGLELRQVKCWSNEFDTKPQVEPTSTPTPWTTYETSTWTPEATATETWEWKPTATWSYEYPMPTMPTIEPYPMQWRIEE